MERVLAIEVGQGKASEWVLTAATSATPLRCHYPLIKFAATEGEARLKEGAHLVARWPARFALWRNGETCSSHHADTNPFGRMSTWLCSTAATAAAVGDGNSRRTGSYSWGRTDTWIVVAYVCLSIYFSRKMAAQIYLYLESFLIPLLIINYNQI